MASGVAKISSKWVGGDLVFYANNTEIARFSHANGFASVDGVKSLVINSTTAQVNAGRIILSGIANKTITVLNATLLAAGTAAGATSVDLTDTHSSPVAVIKWAVAGIVDAVPAYASSTHATAGVGFLAPLTAGRGIKIIKNGSDLATTTAVKTILIYRVD